MLPTSSGAGEQALLLHAESGPPVEGIEREREEGGGRKPVSVCAGSSVFESGRGIGNHISRSPT